MEKVPDGEVTERRLPFIWHQATQMLYDEMLADYPATEQQLSATRPFLTALAARQADKIQIGHRTNQQLHDLEVCVPECFTHSKVFFFFISASPSWATSEDNLACLHIHFNPEHWEATAELLSDVIADDRYASCVYNAKIPNKRLDGPAVIYFFSLSLPDSLLQQIESRLPGRLLCQPSPGAKTVNPWLFYTQLRPDAIGCQPESRADILTRACHFKAQKSLSLTEAISASADYLGYHPEAPEYLKPET